MSQDLSTRENLNLESLLDGGSEWNRTIDLTLIRGAL